jgi:S-formylglutathione hydrolase FrmB
MALYHALGLVALSTESALVPLNVAFADQSQASSLAFISEVQLSPRLREISFKTPALSTKAGSILPPNPTGETRIRVLVPEGYDPKGRQRYPVLYLYHGGGGNQTEWTTPANKGRAEELTAGLPLIIVMPDGGIAGGYSDWYNSGAFGPPKWKTYHLEQLVPWIDAHFQTISERSGRATAGLSMGGGGLRYAALRPDLIGATASFSGDIDLSQPASDWNGMGAPVSRLIWGDRKTDEVRWRAASAPDLAKNLSNTDVAIFTGDTGRPEGLYILQGSTALHERLSKLGIKHQFTVYSGLTHNWPTWNKALADWLPRLMDRFQAFNPGNRALTKWASDGAKSGSGPKAHGATFSYSSIEPSYSLYGWVVQTERKAIEFSALEVADLHNFTIIGSGSAVVHTPKIAKPNVAVQVTITNRTRPDLSKTIGLKTDSEGRLAVPATLGPSNPFQQYTREANTAATGAKADDVPFIVFNNGSRFYRVEVRLKPR